MCREHSQPQWLSGCATTGVDRKSWDFSQITVRNPDEKDIRYMWKIMEGIVPNVRKKKNLPCSKAGREDCKIPPQSSPGARKTVEKEHCKQPWLKTIQLATFSIKNIIECRQRKIIPAGQLSTNCTRQAVLGRRWAAASNTLTDQRSSNAAFGPRATVSADEPPESMFTKHTTLLWVQQQYFSWNNTI